jgi:hypothetical protein
MMGLWVELHCDVRAEGMIGFNARCSSDRNDNPAAMFASTADGRRVVARVRELARTAGFRRLRDGRWTCPGCWLTIDEGRP